MKTIVCYPMKSLVNSFLPQECEILTTENESSFFQLSSIYRPDAAVLFSEMFSQPIWEWVPKTAAALPKNIPIVIVPLHKDEVMVRKIVEEAGLHNIYVLSARLTHEEIRSQIGQLLGVATSADQAEAVPKNVNGGKIYSLMSYGGAGITTFCINYPVLLARQMPGRKIAVVDMNVEKPDLTHFFKLHHYQISLYRPDLIEQKRALQRDWSAVFKQSAYAENLFYSSAVSKWKSNEMSSLLAVLRHRFDYVYLDWGYCFPETEGLQRLLHEADQQLFFVRADPFSLKSATKWIGKWEEQQIYHQLVVSHFDSGHMSVRHIRERLPVYGVVPRISDNRVIQSHQNNSVLIDEIFPPKQYISSLKAIAAADQIGGGVVHYR